jgi:hypothetical protein
MSASNSSGRGYATAGFWERLWRTAGIQFVVLFIIAYIIYGDQPEVGASADALVKFYEGEHTDSDRCGVRRRCGPQPFVVRGSAQDHFGGCRAGRVGRGGDRRKRNGWRAVFPADHDRCSAFVLDRRFQKLHAHTSDERPRVGPGRFEFVPARDAGHGLGIWALAGQANLESAVRGWVWRRSYSSCWAAQLGGAVDSGHQTAPIRGSSRPSSASPGPWSLAASS